MADERRHHPDGLSRETVGERLRGKYERAVRAAADTISRKTSTRGDRDKLVRILLEERFMIPQEESRRALRQIARDTGSSYARVAQCDKQLGQATKIALDADPEFRELDRRARSAPAGTDLPIDRTLEHYLAGASAQEFVRRLRAAAAPERAAMILALLKLSDSGIFDAIHTRIARLPMQLRERLFAQVKTSQ
jgi:hypothetical protein